MSAAIREDLPSLSTAASSGIVSPYCRATWGKAVSLCLSTAILRFREKLASAAGGIAPKQILPQGHMAPVVLYHLSLLSVYALLRGNHLTSARLITLTDASLFHRVTPVQAYPEQWKNPTPWGKTPVIGALQLHLWLSVNVFAA